MNSWHDKTPERVLTQWETSREHGLSDDQARERLNRYGPNTLEQHKRDKLWKRLLSQLKDPMILVLLAAAVLSLLASGFEDWLDSVIILVIVLVNAAISLSQEDNAEKALEALRNMSAPLAKVIRGGTLKRLETTETKGL